MARTGASLLLLASGPLLAFALRGRPAPAPGGARPACRSEEEYARGAWVRQGPGEARLAYVKTLDESNYNCFPHNKRGAEGEELPEYLRYRWAPEACDLEPLDPQALCQALNGSHIGVLGDSTSVHFARGLEGLMLGRSDMGWNGGTVELCQGSVGRSVRLTYVKYWTFPTSQTRKLLQTIKESDILVLNWGAHYHNDSEIEVTIAGKSRPDAEQIGEQDLDFAGRAATDAEVAEGVRSLTSIMREMWVPPKVAGRVFWRATNVYHTDCAAVHAPYAQPFDVDDERVGPFDGHKILRQERDIIWPAVRALGGTILRTDAFTNLRADGHKLLGPRNNARKQDCLHYCEPGPADVWVQLFYNYAVGRIVG